MTEISISDAELEIMRVIWDMDGKVYLYELSERLNEMGKTWKSNTILTFLSRLAEKGMLTVEKKGRINRYSAVKSEKDYTGTLARSFLGKFFGGDAKSLVTALMRQDCLTSEDIAELQDFWNEPQDKGEMVK